MLVVWQWHNSPLNVYQYHLEPKPRCPLAFKIGQSFPPENTHVVHTYPTTNTGPQQSSDNGLLCLLWKEQAFGDIPMEASFVKVPQDQLRDSRVETKISCALMFSSFLRQFVH